MSPETAAWVRQRKTPRRRSTGRTSLDRPSTGRRRLTRGTCAGRPLSGTFSRVPGATKEAAPGTPTTGGLWFRGSIYATCSPCSKSARRQWVSRAFGSGVPAVMMHCPGGTFPGSAQLRPGPGRLPRAGRVTPGLAGLADRLRRTRPDAVGWAALRRARPARWATGTRQDDLGAPGRPEHRPLRPYGHRVLLRARHGDPADQAGRARGRAARRPGRGPHPAELRGPRRTDRVAQGAPGGHGGRGRGARDRPRVRRAGAAAQVDRLEHVARGDRAGHRAGP